MKSTNEKLADRLLMFILGILAFPLFIHGAILFLTTREFETATIEVGFGGLIFGIAVLNAFWPIRDQEKPVP